MMAEGIKMEEETAVQGEVEVERIPTRTIEARSKDLVPVFDFLRHSRFGENFFLIKILHVRLCLAFNLREMF